MSTASSQVDVLGLADETIAFATAFEGWVRKISLESAGESVPRLRLLYELHCNGSQKMADLAEKLGVTPRSVTALVDGLEAEHQVRRVAHPTDRRITMIEITNGAAEIDGQMASLRRQIAGLFDGADGADLAAFERVMTLLRARVDHGPGDGSAR
ncbi:MAG: MarR family winged helix-turn-helix transcriptional regulator [Chloroflexota bacterium]